MEYIPVATQFGNSGGGNSKASSTEKDKEDSFDKAIVKAIGEKGLQSDIDVFHTYAMNLLTTSTYDDLVPGQSAAKLIQLSNYANKLSNSKKYFDDVVEHVRANNTGDDYAMTGDGKVYVGKRDESGKLTVKTMDISKVKENLNEWTPLTNDMLLSIREYDHSFAFKNDMLRDIDGSVGMEQVSETVNDLISKYGNTESRQYLNLDESIKKGLDYLYKITTTHSSAVDIIESNGKLQKDVRAAVKYLYFNLNKNAKNTLKLNADLEGISVEEYLTTAIIHNTSTKTIPDIEKSPAGSNSDSESESNELKTTQTWANMVMEDNGRYETYKTIVNKSTLAFNFPGFIYDGIETKDGKPVNAVTSVSDAVMNLANQGLIDSSKTVYFGDKPINAAQIGSDILIDNSKGASVRYLPVDADGNLSFSMMQQMADIQNKIVQERITDKAQIKKIWEDAGFIYNEKANTGVPKGMRLARFWVQDGYTNENTESLVLSQRLLLEQRLA